MYSQKIIQNLKPDWYIALNKNEKLFEQENLKKRHKEAWNNKPALLNCGTVVVAKETVKSITKGKGYKIKGHFCTLVSTIYSSEWNQFITLKNDYGFTVKMNINNFTL